MGVPWRDWLNSDGASGRGTSPTGPCGWTKSPRYGRRWFREANATPCSPRELVAIHRDNLIVIGTVGLNSEAECVSNRLRHVPKYTITNYGYGYAYALRAESVVLHGLTLGNARGGSFAVDSGASTAKRADRAPELRLRRACCG